MIKECAPSSAIATGNGRDIVEEINRQNQSPGDKIVLIAQALGEDRKRWEGEATSKCYRFVETVLRKAQAPLLWEENKQPDLSSMKVEFLKYPKDWRIAYHRISGEAAERFHARFVPQNGDIAIWDNQQVMLVGILEATFDKRGNILYLSLEGNDHRASFEYRSLDWLVLNDNYGPPDLIVRKK